MLYIDICSFWYFDEKSDKVLLKSKSLQFNCLNFMQLWVFQLNLGNSNRLIPKYKIIIYLTLYLTGNS